MHKISFQTTADNDIVDLTSSIQEAVDEKNIQSGVAILFCPHTTGGIFINENYDPDVKTDLIRKLKETFPKQDNHLHAEGNSDAHIKTSLMGESRTIIIEDGHIQLGRWQGIFFFEGDGPRHREVWIKFMEDKHGM